MNSTRPVLIVSTGRTGTIFFSKILAELYPQCASYHERGQSRLIQIFTHVHFAGILPLKGLKKVWKTLKGHEIPQCQKDFHIDANSFLYGIAYLAPELYPGLRVIHIVRDPRGYVTSHLNFQLQRKTSFIANRFVPFWQPSPFLTGESSLKDVVRMSRFERFCWIWSFKNRIMEKIDQTGTPYLRVRFEDIFHVKHPEEVFGQITDFIGLPRSTNIHDRFLKRANPSTKSNYPDWKKWHPAQCATLNSVCGNLMKQYGYGDEPEWKMKLSQSL